MAVKIVRQPKSIAILGAPFSTASLVGGPENAPQALRAAGLAQRLTDAGFAVTDYGDCAVRAFEPDDEHPRVRGGHRVLVGLEELRPKIEIAVKSGALSIVLGGDNSAVLASIGAVRRYYRDVSLLYLDRDAGLNVPDTTPSGCVDGMVISHVIGRGAPELVRFWREPPLLREPAVALFGVDRFDPPEEQYLQNSPLRRYLAADILRMSPAGAATQALDRVHGHQAQFVLHVDLDVIAAEDFAATNLSAPGGLTWNGVRDALAAWAGQPTLAVLEICCYNPALDPDGSAAKKLIGLLVEVLAQRLAPAEVPAEPAAEVTAKPAGDEAKSANEAKSADEPQAAPPAQVSGDEPPAAESSSPSAPDTVEPEAPAH